MSTIFFALLSAPVALDAANGTPPPPLDVVLYGAYGCIGHLAAFHLANQTKLRWAIAGRNASKLQALALLLAASGGASSRPEIIVASLDGDLSPWVKRTRAVASAAGPFSVNHGEKLVEACAANGVMYSDTSDEFYWQRRMIVAHDAAAKASGARVALAAGFCAVAADLGAALVLDQSARTSAGVKQQGGERSGPVHMDAWLERYSGGISALPLFAWCSGTSPTLHSPCR